MLELLLNPCNFRDANCVRMIGICAVLVMFIISSAGLYLFKYLLFVVDVINDDLKMDESKEKQTKQHKIQLKPVPIPIIQKPINENYIVLNESEYTLPSKHKKVE
uniref:Uncharacterized protein n=1 Tax=Panagrolaimus sp. JU765 TaxID=591449 RepID=A0AC34Q6J5_9BILA